MRDLTARAREAGDADFTLVPDAVHPDLAGGLVIADAFVRALIADQGADDTIDLRAAADAGPGDPREAVVELTRIPYPFQPGMAKASKPLGFGARFGHLTLRAPDLRQDVKWVLHVDGKERATLDAADLATGVDLHGMADTPWTTRQERLAALLAKRRGVIWKKIRNEVLPIKRIKDADARAKRYASIHAELAAAWEEVHALEAEIRKTTAPYEVRIRLEPR